MKSQLGRRRVGRPEISRVLLLSLGFVSPTRLPAQVPISPKSPKEVLLAYREMDAAGQRLTANGWYKASGFFFKPARQPRLRAVAVMEGEIFNDSRVNGNRAEVSLRCAAVGQIDPEGRFTFVVAPSLIDTSGRLLRQPVSAQTNGPHSPLLRVYDLVLTDIHWEFGLKLEDPHEVKGPPEWRIETFEFEPWVTVEVAIRYLNRLRDESSSEMIKSNAEKSIATLRRLEK